jgi:hypothetical protein
MLAPITSREVDAFLKWTAHQASKDAPARANCRAGSIKLGYLSPSHTHGCTRAVLLYMHGLRRCIRNWATQQRPTALSSLPPTPCRFWLAVHALPWDGVDLHCILRHIYDWCIDRSRESDGTSFQRAKAMSSRRRPGPKHARPAGLTNPNSDPKVTVRT